MIRREFLIKMGALGLMGVAPALAGCIGTNRGTGEEQATATATSTPVTVGSEITADSLARTCPRGRSCTSPQCQLWSDLNGDNKCDRGYFS